MKSARSVDMDPAEPEGPRFGVIQVSGRHRLPHESCRTAEEKNPAVGKKDCLLVSPPGLHRSSRAEDPCLGVEDLCRRDCTRVGAAGDEDLSISQQRRRLIPKPITRRSGKAEGSSLRVVCLGRGYVLGILTANNEHSPVRKQRGRMSKPSD